MMVVILTPVDGIIRWLPRGFSCSPSTAGKWRRRPAQPAAVLTGSASPTPFPAKLYPLKTAQMPLYAVGVVPARRQPQSGRISALAGR